MSRKGGVLTEAASLRSRLPLRRCARPPDRLARCPLARLRAARYPKIVEACAQQAHEVQEGESQCDNFYIDVRPTRLVGLAPGGLPGAASRPQTAAHPLLLAVCPLQLNHIIHACTHPSWREVAHEGESEMFMECDLYLDRLVGLMR
jgi:5'-3' exonuclease